MRHGVRHGGGAGDTRGRRGMVLLLVTLSIGFATIAGLTYLATSSTMTTVSIVVDERAGARQVAESGIGLARAYVEQTPKWRESQAPGVWIDGLALLDGTVTVEAQFAPDAPGGAPLGDASFELSSGELATPPLAPPMSGVVGGWELARTAVVETGATVPLVGIRDSALASDGAREAYIEFGLSIDGDATIAQTMAIELQPEHVYEIIVDARLSGLPPIDASFGFDLFAGGTLYCSTREALTAFDTLTPGEVLAQASALLANAQSPCTLKADPIGAESYELTMRTLTGEAPPTGPLRLELFAESIGLLTSVAFDNVRVRVRGNEALTLSALGRRGEATHDVVARVVTNLAGEAQIIEWTEP